MLKVMASSTEEKCRIISHLLFQQLIRMLEPYDICPLPPLAAPPQFNVCHTEREEKKKKSYEPLENLNTRKGQKRKKKM